MRRVIAIDFDKTIYFTDKQPRIGSEVIETLKTLHEEGVEIGLNTGRALRSIQEHIPEAEAIPFDFYITNSGAVIADKEKRVITYRNIDLRTVQRVIESFDNKHLSITAGFTDYVLKKNYTRAKGEFCDPIESWDEVLPLGVQGMVLVYETPGEAVSAYNKLKGMKLNATISRNRTAIDVSPKGIDKGYGLHKARNALWTQYTEVIAVGDGWNDIPAFEEATKGYAVSNAHESLKEVADRTLGKFSDLLVFAR